MGLFQARGAEIGRYYRLLFEQAPDGAFIADERGVYVEVNPAGHRLLGYADGELVGRTIGAIVPVADHPRLAASLAALRRGEVQNEDWVLVRKDGTLVEAEISGRQLTTGLFLGLARDLAPRRQLERQAQASEARLRSTLETAADLIMTVDRSGRVLFINRTPAPLVVAEVLGTRCQEYVPPDDARRLEQALTHVFSTRGFDEFELLGPPGVNGQRRWYALRVGPLIEGGQVVAATICASDIDTPKREAAQRHEFFERLDKIAAQVPGVMYQYKLRPDGSSCFPYASERIREIYRVTPEQVREDAAPVFAVLHPEDHAGVVASLTASAQTLRPWQYEYRVRFEGGDVRWLYASSVPEAQPDGSILWHGFITDVTERRSAAEFRAGLAEQLRQSQKVESIGRLAGGVAHDFNNILTSILGLAELAQAEVPESSRAASLLASMKASAQRGANLTQQLLAFARKKVVKPELVDLSAVLEGLAPMIRSLLGEPSELKLSLTTEPSVVNVDVGSLEQVIMNLAVNARDAMAEVGGQLTIATSVIELTQPDGRTRPDSVPPGPHVVLEVNDTGVGMSEDVVSRLFEPFFTTKPVGQGTGLGLAMCHGIVRQAGGAMSVSSAPGHGSSFRVYLPRIPGARPAATPAVPEIASVGGSETLLIVEDEEVILAVASAALTRLGYRVLAAPDGRAALDLAERTREPIHLLITDVIMPNLGGRELAARLQALRPALKVLYNSGYAENEIAREGVLEPGLNFLQKPYPPSVLARAVRELLDAPD